MPYIHLGVGEAQMKPAPHVCPLPGGAAPLLGASLRQAIWRAAREKAFILEIEKFG